MVATERTHCTYILSYRDAPLGEARSGVVGAIPPDQTRGVRSRFAGFDTAPAPGFAGSDRLRRGAASDRGRERRHPQAHRRGSPRTAPRSTRSRRHRAAHAAMVLDAAARIARRLRWAELHGRGQPRARAAPLRTGGRGQPQARAAPRQCVANRRVCNSVAAVSQKLGPGGREGRCERRYIDPVAIAGVRNVCGSA